MQRTPEIGDLFSINGVEYAIIEQEGDTCVMLSKENFGKIDALSRTAPIGMLTGHPDIKFVGCVSFTQHHFYSIQKEVRG